MCLKVNGELTKKYKSRTKSFIAYKVYYQTKSDLRSCHPSSPGGIIRHHGYIISDIKDTRCYGDIVENGIHTFANKKDAKRWITDKLTIRRDAVVVPVRVNPKNIIAAGPICYTGSYDICFDVPTLVTSKVYISKNSFSNALKKENK